MIYLFHGTDQLAISKTLKDWETLFLQKHPDSTNLNKYTNNIDITNLITEIKSLPFLEDKRLIILPQFPDTQTIETQEKLANEFKNIPDTTILCISSYQKLPKTTNPIHKELIKLQKKSPDIFTIKELNISEESTIHKGNLILQSYNKSINQSQLKNLYLNLQSNPIKFESEIHKLGLFSSALNPNLSSITDSEIQTINYFSTETNVFLLMDNISLRQTKQAFQKITELTQNNEDLIKILFLIVRQFRILIQLHSLIQQKKTETEITTLTKLHPYVVKKTIPHAKNQNLNQLISSYNYLLQIDRQIKTGEIKYHKDTPQELQLAFLKLSI